MFCIHVGSDALSGIAFGVAASLAATAATSTLHWRPGSLLAITTTTHVLSTTTPYRRPDSSSAHSKYEFSCYPCHLLILYYCFFTYVPIAYSFYIFFHFLFLTHSFIPFPRYLFLSTCREYK